MLDKWWEESPRAKRWWDNMAENGSRACHPVAATALGLGASADGMLGMVKTVHREVGFKTSVSIAMRASYAWEKYNLALLATTVYCGSSYIGGGIDALYQIHHNDEHIGTAITDWFISTKNDLYRWWEYEHHWWNV